MSIIKKENEEEVIDLLEVAKLFLKKWYLILLCMIVFGGGTYAGVYYLVTPQYEASVTMYVNNRTDMTGVTAMSQSDLTASAKLVDTYAAIIKNVSVLREVISETNANLSEKELQNAITISAVNNTEVFEVKVLNASPKLAADIANSIATIAPDRIADIVVSSSVKVINMADVPTSIAKPSYRKFALVGVMVGLFISCLFILLKEMFDTSIKSEADFEQWKYPILSTIPDFEQARKSQKGYGYGSYGRK